MYCYFKSMCEVVTLFFHMLLDYMRLMRGVWILSQLEAPIISIFGGSKIGQDHPYAKNAKNIAKGLLDQGYSVITGGGPGIMEAANCTVFRQRGHASQVKSIGIEVEGLGQGINVCADIFIQTRYFFTRKFLLTRYSQGFVVFPGGYGTADELFEIVTLMQTSKLQRFPIVLIGTAYWKSLLAWVENARSEALLLDEDANMLFVTDDLKEAIEHIKNRCQSHLAHQ